MIYRAPRTILAASLAAVCFGYDASASVMKAPETYASASAQPSAEGLPLLPPTLPTERDTLLQAFLAADSDGPAQLFPREPGAAVPHPISVIPNTSSTSVVQPEVLITHRVRRPALEMVTPQAAFSLAEPTSIILLFTGLIGLTARRQMRKQHAKQA